MSLSKAIHSRSSISFFNSCPSSSLGTHLSPKLCFAAARYLHGSHRNIGCAPGSHSCADE